MAEGGVLGKGGSETPLGGKKRGGERYRRGGCGKFNTGDCVGDAANRDAKKKVFHKDKKRKKKGRDAI